MDKDGETDAEAGAPHTINCQVCDRRLMGVSYPVVYRSETLDNLNVVHSDHFPPLIARRWRDGISEYP